MTFRSASFDRLRDSALLPGLCFIYAFAMLAYIQFASSSLVGTDGYYHIRMAELVFSQGLDPEFPWLPLTILDQHSFTDHHFLLHVLQAPFAGLFEDLSTAAKWSAVTIAAAAFGLFGWALQRHGVAYPLVWVALLFAISEPFLYRMSMARGPSLSLAFQLVFIVLMLEARWVALFACTALFVLAYNAFAIVIPIAALGGLAVLIVEGRIEWRLALSVLAGIAAGTVLHPDFPQNVMFAWYHIVPKIFSSEYTPGIGNEWKPYTTYGLLLNSGPAILALLAGLLIIRLESLRSNARLLFWLMLSLFYLFFFMKSRRFAEYYPPVALFFLGVAVADRWANRLGRVQWRKGSSVLGVFAVCAGAFFQYSMVGAARSEILAGPPVHAYRGASEWLSANTKEMETIVHTDWDDFPRLFFYNTRNRYVVGLDPDYLKLRDPVLFDLWRDVSTGRSNDLSSLLDATGSRFVFTDLEHTNFIDQAEANPCVERVYEDAFAIVFAERCREAN